MLKIFAHVDNFHFYQSKILIHYLSLKSGLGIPQIISSNSVRFSKIATLNPGQRSSSSYPAVVPGYEWLQEVTCLNLLPRPGFEAHSPV